MLRIFTPVKIQRLRPGLNPQTWVPEASMLTTRPSKPSRHAIGKGQDNLETVVNSAKSDTDPFDVQDLLRGPSVDIFSIFM